MYIVVILLGGLMIICEKSAGGVAYKRKSRIHN